MANVGRHTLFWYGLALLIIIVDQGSKIWVSSSLDYGIPYEFTSFFNFTLLHNPGAAFSFLRDAGGWQRWLFGIIALGVSGLLVVWLSRLTAVARWEGVALAFVLGGALGNLYDRIALGYVVDFIVFHYHQYHFPAFNIADSAISVGAVMLLIDMLFFKKGEL